jgi:nitrate/nitrite-specific signal transduction histidine kinase
MPEGPEVELEHVHHAIHHEAEHEGGGLVRAIALTTSLLAALAAVASLEAGHAVNEALALKTDATRLQSEASDQWAYYQAKGIKSAVQEAQRVTWLAAHQEPPPALEQKIAQYAQEQKEIEKEARAKEAERDAREKEANVLLGRHNGYAAAVALFQVAIALGAVAALTRLRLVWVTSLVLGVGGLVIYIVTHLR